MNSTVKYTAFIVVGLLACACQKNEWGQSQGQKPVHFKAITGELNTRTSFAGLRFEDFHPLAPDGGANESLYDNVQYSFQRIDWSDGDTFQVYCEESSLSSVYTVSSVVADGSVSIANVDSPSPLVWIGDGVHSFYAMYPAPSQGISGTEMAGKRISGCIPADQAFTQNGKKFLPALDKYGYMYAVTAATQESTYDAITMKFKPLMSCIEVSIMAPSESFSHKVKKIEITSSQDNAFLTGRFTTELNRDGSFTDLSVTDGGNVLSYEFPGDGIEVDALWQYSIDPSTGELIRDPQDFYGDVLYTDSRVISIDFIILPIEQTELTLSITLDSGVICKSEVRYRKDKYYYDPNTGDRWDRREEYDWVSVPPCTKLWLDCELPEID